MTWMALQRPPFGAQPSDPLPTPSALSTSRVDNKPQPLPWLHSDQLSLTNLRLQTYSSGVSTNIPIADFSRILPTGILAALVFLSTPPGEAADAPTNLKAQPLPNPLGLTLNEYAYSWDSTGQDGYQIMVASDEARINADVGDLWDSGRRHSTSNQNVPICQYFAIAAFHCVSKFFNNQY